MTKRKASSLLTLGLVVLLSGTSWCQNSTNEDDSSNGDTAESKVVYCDTVFVQEQGAEGVYSQKTGSIVRLTRDYIIIDINDKRLLYKRQVVQKVELDNARETDSMLLRPDTGWADIVDVYYNKEKSQFVAVLQSTPYVGSVFSFLDHLPPAIGTFLSVLVLVAILFYGVYRMYEALVVAKNLRNLNRVKLNIELSKLHYEIESIRKQLGIVEKITPYEMEAQAIDQESLLDSLKLPKVHVVDFIKYKVLRVLTEEQKVNLTNTWHRRWKSYREKGPWPWVTASRYFFGLLLNFVITIVCLLLWVQYLIMTFVSPFLYDELNLSMPLGSVALFLLFLAFFLRLNAKRRIMRETYRETKV